MNFPLFLFLASENLFCCTYLWQKIPQSVSKWCECPVNCFKTPISVTLSKHSSSLSIMVIKKLVAMATVLMLSVAGAVVSLSKHDTGSNHPGIPHFIYQALKQQQNKTYVFKHSFKYWDLTGWCWKSFARKRAVWSLPAWGPQKSLTQVSPHCSCLLQVVWKWYLSLAWIISPTE